MPGQKYPFKSTIYRGEFVSSPGLARQRGDFRGFLSLISDGVGVVEKKRYANQ